MEGEHHYELRSRSRSRSHTPMVQNQPAAETESAEHHYDLRSRSRERSHTPAEVTSSRRSGTRSLPGSTGKVRDQSMETITEKKEETVTEVAESQNKKSESTTTTTRKAERRSERQKAKRQIFANGQSEVKDENASDHKTEQKRKSVTPRRVLTSDYSSEEGEREDPPSRPGSAYEIYKQAGEWWNVFPKTDYTYSQKSQCRYEIAPGVLAMPNMSRRSIHSDGSSTVSSVPSISQNLSQLSQGTTESGYEEGIDIAGSKEISDQTRSSVDRHMMSHARPDSVGKSVLYKKTHIEHYRSHREVIYTQPENTSEVRERYFSQSTPSRYVSAYGQSQVDSDAELDEAVHQTTITYNQRWKITQWLQSFMSVVTIWSNKVLEFLRLKTARRREYQTAFNYRRYQESRWSRFWQSTDHSLQYVYLFLMKVLVFDTWLLSRASTVRNRIREKGPVLLCIALLPLLLLAGAYVTQKHSFSCLDSLRYVRDGVAETTYHIFNDISNLTTFVYQLLAKYVADLKNYSLNLLPSVNVSLPEMPSIGWKY